MGNELQPPVPCADKLVFASKDNATGSAVAIKHQRNLNLTPYKCRHCGLWHLATSKPQ